MVEKLFDTMLLHALSATVESLDDVTEIRMRVGHPLVVATAYGRKRVRCANGFLCAKKRDVDRVLNVASDFSLYAVNDKIVQGYLTYRGVRIGVSGVGVVDGERFLSVSEPNYLTLRFPHQVKGCADKVFDQVFDTKKVRSTLVVSPPAAGKTTMLRELARKISPYANTVVIDERFELAAVCDGVPTLDVGEADVISGVKKCVAYENVIRSMNPEVLVTDELFREEDVASICDAARCGVKVLASVHAEGVNAIANDKRFAPLLSAFEVYVTLSKCPQVGTVLSVERGGK